MRSAVADLDVFEHPNAGQWLAVVTPTPAAAAAAPAASSEPTDEEKKKGEKEKSDGEKPASDANTFASVNARFQTVVASEHYAGNEPLAHALLGDAFTQASMIRGIRRRPYRQCER